MNDDPPRQHARPAGVTDAEVQTAGKMTEALERLERARGHLYAFHQLMGETDLMLDEVLEGLSDHPALAATIARELRGRNVLEGRWTFQVVEEFDDGYWSRFRRCEQDVRAALTVGRRHVLEAEMKERRRSDGLPGHEAIP